MPRPIPPPLGLTLAWLRMARGWTQQELATAAGASRNVVCSYETGQGKNLSRERLEELVAVMGYGSAEIELALRTLRAVAPAEAEEPPSPAELSGADLRRARLAAARFGLEAAEVAERHLRELGRGRRVRQARARAARLWRTLARRRPAERRLLVEAAAEFRSWAVCERLCEESERAAADRATRALGLARLALRAAELAAGSEGWRRRLRGFCWAFVANALRVGGRLPAAEAAWARAWRLWREGEGADPGILPEWRLLDREASLRRALRQWDEALALLDRARAAAPPTAAGRILLNRALTLEQAGESEAALAALYEAAPIVAGAEEPRLSCVLRFNVITNLCHLGRHREAAELVPQVRQLAVELGNELDLIRVLWLGGRVAAGQGRRGEARAAFNQARRDFAAHGNGYDAALVALELAVLELEDGHTVSVRGLAKEMVWVFRAQGVYREALAALRLFGQAAEAETATAEQARRLLAYMERARHYRRLRWSDGG
ncbi:MAG TPA: helix-turn-helix transcriptional regulator [Thermoanaerobaculia bacterium]|nr:helix-turn-helix transcriptional regulator [Thermoanaerobaculia bacterium]